MAYAAGLTLACEHYGASGLPGTERPSSWLRVDCGFNDDDGEEVESVYERMARASEEQWEKYLRGRPLPREDMAARDDGLAEERERKGEGEKPAFKRRTKLQGETCTRVLPGLRKGVERAQEQMDVARRMREPEAKEGKPVVQSQSGAAATAAPVVRREAVPPEELEGDIVNSLRGEEPPLPPHPQADLDSEASTSASRPPAAWTRFSGKTVLPRPVQPPIAELEDLLFP
ncbi:hypothetical protein CALVIDRAFT_556179 [Calocera viscosa TUFC12733]|uniref:Uncharacterized protein n=1 Tax=Calocera viscosa (strain TUFC12733) TaxID=1330018 RepID=A0A167KI13_CALVF|nr:hypothetical protein CALVIDRAFT_556179 [Calocera viscosa TUFC12733]